LYFPDASSKFSYLVFDMLGQKVQAGTASSSLDVSGLSAGLFTLVVQTNETEFSTRFVKQ